MTNSVDTNQTAPVGAVLQEQSDLGPHCLTLRGLVKNN